MSSASLSTAIQFEQARTPGSLSECYFYHTMDLPGYGVVHGEWDLRGRFDSYTGHVDFFGRSVLDVGTASGFLSFEAERLGAEVVSFDIGNGSHQHLLPFRDGLYWRDHQRWAAERTALFDKWKNAYWLAHQALQSRAQVYYGDVYNIPAALGAFDITLVGSVLEHLRDPIAALESLSRVTGRTLVIVTPMLNTEEPVARFLGRADAPELDYSWWLYSLGTYREVLGILGYKITACDSGLYQYNRQKEPAERYTLVAERA